MTPDAVQIGSHFYGLTLNLFLTAFVALITATFALASSIIYFRYRRKVGREDTAKEKLETAATTALAKLVEARHDTLIDKFQDTKETIIDKIDSHVAEQKIWQASIDDRFYSHGHRVNLQDGVTVDVILKKG